MRIPGIKSIMCCPASSLPADIEMKVAAGAQPSIIGVSFIDILFIGDPVCTLEDSNENNGNVHKVSLSFTTPGLISCRQNVWVVVTNAGETYLIGSRDSIPSFRCTDTTAGAAVKNASEVTIELESFCSWINVGDVLPTYIDGGYVTFQDWRKVADSTYAKIVHRHDTNQVDDQSLEMTQEQANVMLLGEIDELNEALGAAL